MSFRTANAKVECIPFFFIRVNRPEVPRCDPILDPSLDNSSRRWKKLSRAIVAIRSRRELTPVQDTHPRVSAATAARIYRLQPPRCSRTVKSTGKVCIGRSFFTVAWGGTKNVGKKHFYDPSPRYASPSTPDASLVLLVKT